MFLLILFVILCYVFYCELNDLKNINKIYEKKINILTEQVELFLKIEKIYLQKFEKLEFQNAEILRINEERINLIKKDVENILLTNEYKINFVKEDVKNILSTNEEKIKCINEDLVEVRTDISNNFLSIRYMNEDLEEVKMDISNNLLVNISEEHYGENLSDIPKLLFIHINVKKVLFKRHKSNFYGGCLLKVDDNYNYAHYCNSSKINLKNLTNLEHIILGDEQNIESINIVRLDNLENLKKIKYLTFCGHQQYEIIKSSSLEEIKFDMLLYSPKVDFLKEMYLPNLKKVIFRKCKKMDFTKNEFMNFYENKYELVIDN
jgi:hypothetical protein